MSKLFLKSLLAGPAVLGAALAFSGNAVAAEAADTVAVDTVTADAVAADTVSVDALTSADSVQLAQVTSVSELSDVRPTDWAFTALQRLVEEYGCLEGYPDRTYRGNRAMSRYEFAAGLNACLDVIVQLIGDTNIAEELDTIRRLQEEFAAELATLRGRVDTLEADVAELEANQFSTTTKLRGQLDAHLVVPFEADDDDEVTFEYRSRMNFDTSFTGEDRLRVRLQASDSGGSLAGFPGGLANQSGTSGDIADNVGLDDVYYSFPIGNRISAIIAANSIVSDDFVTSTIVPFDGPAVGDVSGPEFYDIIGAGGDSFAAGVNFAFTDNIILDLGYSTNEGQDPDEGIFETFEYIAQLNFLSDGLIDAAVTFMDGEGGDPDVDSIIAGLLNLDFGGFEVGGHYAFVDGPADDTWSGGVAFSDFLSTGNSLGAYVGESSDDDFFIEGYYEFAVNEFMTFTPALLYSDPDDGDESFYGVLRTTFQF
ncbi:MAG: iron uptake porin [Cyanobacteria bacterium P01_D01_bin.44]